MKDEQTAGTRAKPHQPSSFIPQPLSWRIFCAIELPQRVCDQANEQIRKLKSRFPNLRSSWTGNDRLHLTLKFLGEIPKERVESLSGAAEHASAVREPFRLIIESAGAFPQSGPAKVLWLGVTDVQGGLIDLHTSLEDECLKEGFKRDERPFYPHLTLARLRGSQSARSLASFHKEIGFPAVEFAVAALLVIRSELSSTGSKYTVVSRHPFTGTS